MAPGDSGWFDQPVHVRARIWTRIRLNYRLNTQPYTQAAFYHVLRFFETVALTHEDRRVSWELAVERVRVLMNAEIERVNNSAGAWSGDVVDQPRLPDVEPRE